MTYPLWLRRLFSDHTRCIKQDSHQELIATKNMFKTYIQLDYYLWCEWFLKNLYWIYFLQTWFTSYVLKKKKNALWPVMDLWIGNIGSQLYQNEHNFRCTDILWMEIFSRRKYVNCLCNMLIVWWALFLSRILICEKFAVQKNY